jgi:hypothetical protein
MSLNPHESRYSLTKKQKKHQKHQKQQKKENEAAMNAYLAEIDETIQLNRRLQKENTEAMNAYLAEIHNTVNPRQLRANAAPFMPQNNSSQKMKKIQSQKKNSKSHKKTQKNRSKKN